MIRKLIDRAFERLGYVRADRVSQTPYATIEESFYVVMKLAESAKLLDMVGRVAVIQQVDVERCDKDSMRVWILLRPTRLLFKKVQDV